MDNFQGTSPGPGVGLQVDATACDGQRWRALVERIKQRDAEAMTELYESLSLRYPYYFLRQVGQDNANDAVHAVFVATVKEILEGNVREPERLMGFVRTIAQRYGFAHIERAVAARAREVTVEYAPHLPDRRASVEETMLNDERRLLMRSCLDQMLPRDREILERFYLHEQTAEQIMQEMGLTRTQFRITKSRAKAEFGEIGRRKMKWLRSPLRGMALRQSVN